MYSPIQPNLQDKLNKLANIPHELKACNQWIVWRYEDIGALKPTKVPYNAATGTHAATNDPSTWVGFDIACAIYASGKFNGIGFVFTKDDPYIFIDLDDTNGNKLATDRQLKIFREFNSYSEVSPSGSGLHIICKGDVPSGRKRSNIEIYSTGRYATFTGNIYGNYEIKNCQHLIMQLWEQMGSSIPQTFMVTGDEVEKETDKTIIERASNASNGDKFKDLFNGRWDSYYPSQSEADLAIVDIVAFYTQNRNQIKRIFHASELGKRLKAHRQDYLEWMINKSFDTMLPQIDFDGFKNLLQSRIIELHKTETTGASPNGKASVFDTEHVSSTLTAPATLSPAVHLTLPPGLLGEIAQFIYLSAPRPVPEIALAAAIGLMSGIAGRAYNVSQTGLNIYTLLLAGTGTGKEGMSYGIDKLMNVVRQQVPTAVNFIGPSEIASGQALIKYISNNSQCFVSILGEFGLRLLQMANQNANGAEVSLRRMLLDLYNKSGYGQLARPSIYADKDKNTIAIHSPAFSILGESTPERFYGALNEDMISEGLLPRFLLIEYTGPRVAFNEQHGSVQPSFSLIERLTTLCANAETVQNANPRRVVNVKFTTDAQQIANDYDKYCDRQINLNLQKDVLKQLWNRAHIKVLKLAGIIAVGVNMYDPVIEAEHIKWAISMVDNDISTLTVKFEEGKIGSSTQENKQVEELIRTIKEYIMSDFDKIKKYCEKNGSSERLHLEHVLPYSYLSRKLIAQNAFKSDKLGATTAIKRTLQIMVERDYLREVGRHDMTNKFGTTQKAFVISNSNILK